MDVNGRKIVYLSGPITGTDDYMERFARAEERLTKRGYAVINPARVCAQLPELEHDQYMQVCVPMIEVADVIYMLKHWEESKGAKMEYFYAQFWSVKILDERDDYDPESSVCGTCQYHDNLISECASYGSFYTRNTHWCSKWERREKGEA